MTNQISMLLLDDSVILMTSFSDLLENGWGIVSSTVNNIEPCEKIDCFFLNIDLIIFLFCQRYYYYCKLKIFSYHSPPVLEASLFLKASFCFAAA